MRTLFPFALFSLAVALPSSLTPRSCPAGYSYPADAIVPYALIEISQASPDTAYGSVPVGIVTPNDKCTIVDLKIPDTYKGLPTVASICTLSFSLPTTKSFSGPGHFSFFGYLTGFGGEEDTTWNKQPIPGPSPPFPPDVMVPGNSYVIADLPCGILPGSGGQTVSGRLCSEDTTLEWEQTGVDVECPVGFFVVIKNLM